MYVLLYVILCLFLYWFLINKFKDLWKTEKRRAVIKEQQPAENTGQVYSGL